MDKCKLCGSEPVPYQNFQGFKLECSNRECTLNGVLMFEGQWCKLMGEPEPDIFWEEDYPELGIHYDPDSLVDEVVDDMAQFRTREAVIKVACAVQLPSREIKITYDEVQGGTNQSWEWVK